MAGQVLSGRARRYPGVIVANFLSMPAEPASCTLSLPTSGKCECNWNNDDLRRPAVEGLRQHQPSSASVNQMQSMVSRQAPVFTIANQTNIVAVQQPGAGRLGGPAGQPAPRGRPGWPADRAGRRLREESRGVDGPVHRPRRIVTSLALLVVSSMLIFLVMRVIPGDPTITKLGGSIKDVDPQTLRDDPAPARPRQARSRPSTSTGSAASSTATSVCSYFSQFPVTTLISRANRLDAAARADGDR